MQFTKKAIEHIEACRFCWMCHHVCPIGNATGLERNTARARALGLSLVAREATALESDIVDNLYECALCGGCMTDCVTGWDPVMFTKEARLGAALEGNMPEYVGKLIDNIEATGNIYGEKEIPEILKSAIRDLPPKADVLFFIGKDGAYRTADKSAAAVDLLKRAGVDLTVHKYEPDSGYALDFLIGAAEETRSAMAKTAEILNETGASTIVCYDPADAKVFLREYKEYGIDIKANVVTFTSFIAGLIKDGRLDVKKSDTAFTPQETPLLARDLEETESVRAILNSLGSIKEMLLHGKDTVLAGNLIMNEYIPSVMKAVAERRMENAKNVGAKVIVTVSPAEYRSLSDNNDTDIEIITLEEAVLRCL
ncbi:MAG: (Fe-S)-binding protein [Clostridia bacterium]|nr:(Fe-S)-binding protein [Clostridia bacterium]